MYNEYRTLLGTPRFPSTNKKGNLALGCSDAEGTSTEDHSSRPPGKISIEVLCQIDWLPGWQRNYSNIQRFLEKVGQLK